MRADETWRLWRRVLREPALSDAVIGAEIGARATEFGLGPEQLQIALMYAAHGECVRWAVDGYRYRLRRVTNQSVAEGAPLTATYLRNSGHDLDALINAFVESTGWLDDGPYIYTSTIRYLDFLQRALREPDAAAGTAPAVFDVLRLERAGAELVIRCSAPPATVAGVGDGDDRRYRWTGRGTVVSVDHDLTGWLADQRRVDLASAAERAHSMLVYLDGSPAHYAIANIGAGAARVAAAFATGADLGDVAATLALSPADARLLAVLDTFLDWGVLAAAPATVRPGAAAGSEACRANRRHGVSARPSGARA
jgi:hypothetical protein